MTKKGKRMNQLPLHLMLIPALIIILIYSYGPMVGIVISFQRFVPNKGLFGSEWIGFGNFEYVMNLPNTMQILWNTIYISFMKIVAGFIFPLTASLMLNEMNNQLVKRSIQTIIYLPHFLSWVI